MNAKEAKKLADSLLEKGVSTKETFLEAVPALFELEDAIRNVKDWVAKLNETYTLLSDKAAAYAIDHVTALDEPLAEAKDGIVSGTVDIAEKLYRLTISKDSPKRISGGTLTQGFLSKLPTGWTNQKLSLSATALQHRTSEELEKHDLYRPIKRVWSIAKKVA